MAVQFPTLPEGYKTYGELVSAALKGGKAADDWFAYLAEAQAYHEAAVEHIKSLRRSRPGMSRSEALAHGGFTEGPH